MCSLLCLAQAFGAQDQDERRLWLQQALQQENQLSSQLLKKIVEPADEESLKALMRITKEVDRGSAVYSVYRSFAYFGNDPVLAERAVDFLVDEVQDRREGIARVAVSALGQLMPYAEQELYDIAQRSEIAAIRAIALTPILNSLAKGQTRAGLELILDDFQIGRTGTAGVFCSSLAQFSLANQKKTLKKRLRDRKYPAKKKQLILIVLQDPAFADLVDLAQSSLLDDDSRVASAALAVVQTHGGALKASALKKLGTADDPALRLQAMVVRARQDWGTPAMQKELASWLASRDRVRRQAAARALAIAPQAEHVEQLAELLNDSLQPIRLEAVLSLAACRRPDALEALIGAAEHESRVTAELTQRALFALTGQGFGPSVTTWRRWWADHQATWSAPTASALQLALFEAQVAVEEKENHTGASFWGVPVVSRNVAFVIDMSGSMETRFAQAGKYGAKESTRLAAALAQLEQAITQLPDGTRMALVPFGGKARPWKQELVSLEDGVRQASVLWAENLGTLGGTNLHQALQVAFSFEEVDTIYVLSDGEPSGGEINDPGLLRLEINRWNATRRIPIHTISIGGPEGLMRGLAADSGGVFRKVE